MEFRVATSSNAVLSESEVHRGARDQWMSSGRSAGVRCRSNTTVGELTIERQILSDITDSNIRSRQQEMPVVSRRVKTSRLLFLLG